MHIKKQYPTRFPTLALFLLKKGEFFQSDEFQLNGVWPSSQEREAGVGPEITNSQLNYLVS